MINVNRKITLTAALGITLGLAISTVRADVTVQTMTHFGGDRKSTRLNSSH